MSARLLVAAAVPPMLAWPGARRGPKAAHAFPSLPQGLARPPAAWRSSTPLATATWAPQEPPTRCVEGSRAAALCDFGESLENPACFGPASPRPPPLAPPRL